jgi:hypothetical protein
MIKIIIVNAFTVRTFEGDNNKVVGKFRAQKELEIPQLLPNLEVNWHESKLGHAHLNDYYCVYEAQKGIYVFTRCRDIYESRATMPTVAYREAGWTVSNIELL